MPPTRTAADTGRKHSSAIKAYQDELSRYQQHGGDYEGATRVAFHNLLAEWGKAHNFVIVDEPTIEAKGRGKAKVQPDGVLKDDLNLHRGYWEAKDTKDDLDTEIRKKLDKGYPDFNIIFEDTRRGVLYQDGQLRFTADLRDEGQLRQMLDLFTGYNPPRIEEFHKAVSEFRERIPELAKSLTALIDNARRDNPKFKAALNDFLQLCRTALNPDTTQEQVEDMLKQHILTERIFRSIFQNPDFVRRNAVAAELEKMVDALTRQSFSRDSFLGRLDYFYQTIEDTARTIRDYTEKQELLNALYEKFFQAYSTRTADTHGIVYTPQEIVRWMVASVQKALQAEFGLGLESPGVHIIDPCVGTGTFMMEILRRIPASYLEEKYAGELHANEIQLLPYYIAAQNIEHAYLERTGEYRPFEGICFADTLDIMDTPQLEMFALANSERVQAQKQAPIRVVIGNPPYNVGQENENDNNKNRKHPTVDKRIAETYVKGSRATLRSQLYDPYVKFFRWATDRLQDRDGIVCFVSNNSFLNQFTFDGMRRCLLEDFTRIYTFDLGGNVRKNPKLSGTKNNVFGIQVGVTITLLIRNKQKHNYSELHYARLDEFWTKEQKLKYLSDIDDYNKMHWQLLKPDVRNTWLTEGMSADFDTFLSIGTKEAKAAKGVSVETIFKAYSSGVFTGRDAWIYDFSKDELCKRVKIFLETYNEQVFRWTRRDDLRVNVDDFVLYDDTRIKWSRNLKRDLQRGQFSKFSHEAVRNALYRPFTKEFLYFADQLVDERGTVGTFFPTLESEQNNNAICVTDVASEKPFMVMMTNLIADAHLVGAGAKTQCFPFYTYAEDGSNRRENVTDWALQQFRAKYGDESITKWDIFHYVYAVLHAPWYRQKYAENLKRDLPRIPFVAQEKFRAYVEAGEKLAKLHRDYEQAPRFPLHRKTDDSRPVNWKVNEKGMKLSPDRASLRYNDWLTLEGIPPAVFDYRLGNRSALEWVIDQYRVSVDTRSGLRHDPNDPAQPRAIYELIERVIQVSLDTLAILEGLKN